MLVFLEKIKSFKDALYLVARKNIVSITAAAIGATCSMVPSFLAPVLAGASGALSLTLTMVIGINYT